MEDQNTVVIILQIVTLAISAIALVTELFSALVINKKTLTSEIVAKQRLIFMEQIRSSVENIMCLCDIHIIEKYRETDKEVLGTGDVESVYLYKLLLEANKIKLLLKKCFKQEAEINETMDELVEIAVDCYENSNNKSHEEYAGLLKEKSHKFFSLINRYDLAYWDFIIAQASGSYIKSEDFDRIYQKHENKFTD